MNGDIDCDIPRTRRIKVIDINPHLMCVLCGGYYVDATTIIECLHSFCKSCIVRYLDTSKFCPICDVQVHKTKPLLNIRSDQTLQDIVYKLVPGLFQREMRRRREFYAKQPPEALKNSLPRSNEERGEVDYSSFPHNIFSPDEFISIALEYSAMGAVANGHDSIEKSPKNVCRRYLRCPVIITVAHIKKLIRAKYGLSSEQRVDLMFSRDSLNDEFMIMDIAYMYAWKRKGPLKLYYRIFDQPNKRLKTFHVQNPSTVASTSVEVRTEAKPLFKTERKSSSLSLESPLEGEKKSQLSSSSTSLSLDNKEPPDVNGKREEKVNNSVTVKDKEQLLKKTSVKDDGREMDESVVVKDVSGQEEKKKEDEKEAEAKKVVDVIMVECKKISLLEKKDDKEVSKSDEKSVCDLKTNGDFKVPAPVTEKPLREKVNGITTNGKKDNVREMTST